MALSVQGFGWGVDRLVDLLVLQMQRHVPGILGRPGSPFLGIPVMPPWFDQGPLGRGHYSFVGEHLTSSIVLAGDGSALSGRHIACFHSRMGDFACYLEMGFAGRGPST